MHTCVLCSIHTYLYFIYLCSEIQKEKREAAAVSRLFARQAKQNQSRAYIEHTYTATRRPMGSWVSDWSYAGLGYRFGREGEKERGRGRQVEGMTFFVCVVFPGEGFRVVWFGLV